jgi:exosortase A-associated hydrolase 2
MLSVPDGFRFCLLHEVAKGVPLRGGIVFAQPFAEEMNKSRRAVAVASRAFAREGWSVLQIDLSGCGDSSGDFAAARWHSWKEDLLRAVAWFQARAVPVRILWGLRLGALLACSIIDQFDAAPDLLFWQPVVSGKVHLNQFLRLKSAESMLGGSGQQGVVSRLRAELAAGSPVEVAGYTLHPELALKIDTAELILPSSQAGRTCWLECSQSTPPQIQPASAKLIEAWAGSERAVTAQVVGGPPFWQTVEIEEAPELTAASLDWLRQESAGARSMNT